MRTKDFAFVGAKITGIILFILGIQMMIHGVTFWEISTSMGETANFPFMVMFTYFFLAIFYLGIGIYFWGFTAKIVILFLPKDSRNETDGVDERKGELKELQTAAFTVVGLVILTNAIPKLFYTAVDILSKKDYYFSFSSHRMMGPALLQLTAKILEPLVYLTIGIYLLFGIKNFLSMLGKGISRLRGETGGEDEDTEE
jgi:hypothetical protein